MDSNISDEQLLAKQFATLNEIAQKLNSVPDSSPVAVAIEMILMRLVASGNSLQVLYNQSPHDCSFDSASILRNIYDITLQGLYILCDPDKRDERARLYLDFMHIERKQRINLLDSNPTALAKRISGSPKRTGAEPGIMKQFDSVKAKYTTKKGKPRNTWYKGDLRELSKEVKLEEEYGLLQRLLSGVVHSSPLTLADGPLIAGYILMQWNLDFAFRIIGAYAEHKNVSLNEEERSLIERSQHNILD